MPGTLLDSKCFFSNIRSVLYPALLSSLALKRLMDHIQK